MILPLMPKATAVWLVENTALTFEQIGDFCGLHALEIQGIADDEVAIGIVGLDPIANSQLTREELERCVADPQGRLQIAESGMPRPTARSKGARYTPLSKRQDRPDAIAWTIRFHPEITDAQVVKLLGTTKNTINAVRERTHWNINNIKPHDPVSLGICTQTELDEAVTLAQAKLRAREEREEKARAKADRAAGREPAPPSATAGEKDAAPAPEKTVAAIVAPPLRRPREEAPADKPSPFGSMEPATPVVDDVPDIAKVFGSTPSTPQPAAAPESPTESEEDGETSEPASQS
jgi:hypothetical protein